MEGSPDALRKTACKGLTAVLKRSPLADSVDPKSFFMMLNSNFAVLAREDGIDLAPVFEALRNNGSEDQLAALFLQFELKGTELGIPMLLPAQVAALDSERKASLLAEAERASPPRSSSTIDAPAGHEGPAEEREASGTAELVENVEGLDEDQRKVVLALVRGFRAAPGIEHIPASQLSYFIGSRLDELLEAQARSVRFEPIVDALRQAAVQDHDIYVGFAFSKENLQPLGLEAIEPTLEVRPELKPTLIKRAKDQQRAARGSSAVKGRAPSEVAQGDKKSLEELGLGLKEGNPGRRKAIRIGALLGVAAVSGVLGFVFRPDRPLSTAAYEGTLPLVSARLDNGRFQAVLDDAAWKQLSEPAKRERYEAFAAHLEDRALTVGAQVRDGSGRLLVTSSGPKLRASPLLFKD